MRGLITTVVVVGWLAGSSGCALTDSQAGYEAPERPATLAADVAAIPAGATVHILQVHGHSLRSTSGTVLKSSSNGVALANCRVNARQQAAQPVMSRVPYFGRLYKNTGVGTSQVPVLWVPLAEMTTCNIVSPPVEGQPVITTEIINPSDEVFYERIGIDVDFAAADE